VMCAHTATSPTELVRNFCSFRGTWQRPTIPDHADRKEDKALPQIPWLVHVRRPRRKHSNSVLRTSRLPGFPSSRLHRLLSGSRRWPAPS
jgi:hypothetical protein